ncbi:hypothetical protein I4F81_012467 [Pyropia yezoensis]|uniref:Uncharacterized protein n=1 Tax=Pyropia yezoensis TaxID=2788 RepID=A0ACC3CJJ9_PYRYE|nr:hypothetical protein I4F81_012467 [Neopyropia yezoensis]
MVVAKKVGKKWGGGEVGEGGWDGHLGGLATATGVAVPVAAAGSRPTVDGRTNVWARVTDPGRRGGDAWNLGGQGQGRCQSLPPHVHSYAPAARPPARPPPPARSVGRLFVTMGGRGVTAWLPAATCKPPATATVPAAVSSTPFLPPPPLFFFFFSFFF